MVQLLHGILCLSLDYFEIIVAVYSPDGSQLLGAVSCMETDTGYMFVPVLATFSHIQLGHWPLFTLSGTGLEDKLLRTLTATLILT